jgi:hypothetical protein
MDEPTILGLVDRIHDAATEVGMDVSPKDVAFIISLFFEGLALHNRHEGPKEVNDWLQSIADEVNKTKDGG